MRREKSRKRYEALYDIEKANLAIREDKEVGEGKKEGV